MLKTPLKMKDNLIGTKAIAEQSLGEVQKEFGTCSERIVRGRESNGLPYPHL